MLALSHHGKCVSTKIPSITEEHLSRKHQKEELLKSQRRCWPLTCVSYWYFLSIVCTKVDVIFVSVAWNSRNITKCRTGPCPKCFIVEYETNYFLQKCTSKRFLDVDINWSIDRKYTTTNTQTISIDLCFKKIRLKKKDHCIVNSALICRGKGI